MPELAALCVFEVDLPEVIKKKRAALSRAGSRVGGAARDQAVSAAFNSMTAAWFAGRATWDKSDRWAAEILEAFDRRRLDEDH
jgi:hypothetical protein